MQGQTRRVLLADDHAMVREGVRSLLRGTEFQVIAEAETGQGVIDLASRLSPDVILLDVRLPDVEGTAALAELRRRHPQVPVLMLSSFENPDYVVTAMTSGAAGYILKGVGQEELLAALRAVVAGEAVMGSALVRSLALDVGGRQARPELAELERAILSLIVQGHSDRQIGQRLTISEGLVREKVRSLLGRLGVSARLEAAAWAAEHGLPLTKSRSVLVVDDEPHLRDTLQDILSLAGFETEAATDGAEAVERTRRRPFSTVLMDILMPRLNGVEAFRRIRQERPDANVLLMTGHSVSELIAEATHLGCRHVLRKPLDIPQLLQLVAA